MELKKQINLTIGPGGEVRWGCPLPPNYRVDENERCIELPLVLTITHDTPLILDAGCALNYPKTHTWVRGHIVHVGLGREPHHAHARRHYVEADLRNLPFRTASCPSVVCVSTLEHIGMDNRHYGWDANTRFRESWVRAAIELRRVATETILVTVPCGRSETHPSGRWAAFDERDLAILLQLFAPIDYSLAGYQKDETGWRLAPPAALYEESAWNAEGQVVGMAALWAQVTT